MPATSVSAAENYISARKTARIFGDHAGNPTGRTGRKSSSSQRQREREREKRREGGRTKRIGGRRQQGGEEGIAPKNGDGGTTESASSRDRAETRRNGRAITLPGRGVRGDWEGGLGGGRTLPNPISMSPVALFSPARLRLPDSSRPTRFELPPSLSLSLSRSLSFSLSLFFFERRRYPTLASVQPEHPLGRPTIFRSRSHPSCPTALLPAIRGRIERSMGPADYQSSATFSGQSWVASVSPTRDDFANFRSLKARRVQLASTSDLTAVESNFFRGRV